MARIMCKMPEVVAMVGFGWSAERGQ
jgi:hypothetical protein